MRTEPFCEGFFARSALNTVATRCRRETPKPLGRDVRGVTRSPGAVLGRKLRQCVKSRLNSCGHAWPGALECNRRGRPRSSTACSRRRTQRYARRSGPRPLLPYGW